MGARPAWLSAHIASTSTTSFLLKKQPPSSSESNRSVSCVTQQLSHQSQSLLSCLKYMKVTCNVSYTTLLLHPLQGMEITVSLQFIEPFSLTYPSAVSWCIYTVPTGQNLLGAKATANEPRQQEYPKSGKNRIPVLTACFWITEV